LPFGRNPRTPHSRAAARLGGSDADYIRAVLAIFREQEFYYTLLPPGLERDSWMTSCSTRAGFLRPFRLGIHGAHARGRHPGAHRRRYQGGDWNPVGGYLIVRQSHAHAWSEVWLPGRDGGALIRRPPSHRAHRARHRGVSRWVGTRRGGCCRDSEFFWQAGCCGTT
jgi:hypothetical protein